jgi:hypothetical protein
MNSPEKSVPELIAELKAHGVTKEQIADYTQQELDRRDREETLDFDPLDAISSKLDKLQESVDGLAAKLDTK